jgi:hypothetical protein
MLLKTWLIKLVINFVSDKIIMHPEDEDYDDEYEDSQDYPDSQYKKYFKFDPEAWDAWGKWLYDAMNDIVESSPNVWYIGPGFDEKSFPVNSYFSNTGKNKPFQYLGNNYQQQPIWKTKYFVNDPLSIEYINHVKNNSVHFLLQPHYYKGMFDILN